MFKRQTITYTNYRGDEVEMEPDELTGYQTRETREWLFQASEEDNLACVKRHDGGAQAILLLFNRYGFDSSAQDIWDDLPDSSRVKRDAANRWCWYMYEDHYWRIQDFLGSEKNGRN